VSGEIKWKDIRALEGKGSLTYADGNLYLLSDEGEVALARATPTSKNLPLKGKFSLPALSKINETRPTNAGAKVWTHPVIANGRLYIRDQELIYCYAVK
jgi:hypothetical protein